MDGAMGLPVKEEEGPMNLQRRISPLKKSFRNI